MVVRQKWHTSRRDIEVGDVVTAEDANTVRGQWRIGVVTDVIPSSDSKVRRVKVKHVNTSKTGFTIVERAVHRLIVLVPVKEDGDSEPE